MQFIKPSTKPLKILDFDIECRPLSWISSDYVSKEVTAIAWRFVDESDVQVVLLGEHDPNYMFSTFRKAYDKADIVTGHFIRGYDLPTLNGALIERGHAPLSDKLTQDTKSDLIKMQGISKSQESLGALLGLEHSKVSMTQDDWREANRLSPQGIKRTRERVVGDVNQHVELRERLIQQKLLGPPVLWRSTSSTKPSRYVP